MGGKGLCGVTADGNKILIITSHAAKHYSDFLSSWPPLFTARVFLAVIRSGLTGYELILLLRIIYVLIMIYNTYLHVPSLLMALDL